MSQKEMFKTGQRVRCIDAINNVYVSEGREGTVEKDQHTGSEVRVLLDGDDRSHNFYTYRFELVGPKFPTLTAGQRVTMSGGDVGIVVANEDKGVAIKLKDSTWTEIYFDKPEFPYTEWNVVAVYAAPSANHAFKFDVKGDLVWDKDGTIQKVAAAQAKLDAALAAAQTANDAVGEARAALNAVRT